MAATGSTTAVPNSNNQSNILKSPMSNSKEVDRALDQMFKGFSFYSEPVEEQEVQRQIKEYLRMKNSLKRQRGSHQRQLPKLLLEEKSKSHPNTSEFSMMPPKPNQPSKQSSFQSTILLNSIKTAAQTIASQRGSQERLESLITLGSANYGSQQTFGNMKKHDQSSIIDEEVSIA